MLASIVSIGVKSYEFNMLELYGLRRVHSPFYYLWLCIGKGKFRLNFSLQDMFLKDCSHLIGVH